MAVNFDKQAAQGDILLTKIAGIPEGAKAQKAEGNDYIVAHSETGHNHVISADNVTCYEDASNPFIMYVDVKEATTLRHLRSFDTHQTLNLAPGAYRINRQREYIPEGFRRAQD